MTYELFIGDRSYSSWSLRGWLLFSKFGQTAKITMVDFADKDVAAQLANITPAKTVPTLVTPEGAVVSDSLAIAEELASRHPDAGYWPSDKKARAIARSLTAEMHSGFSALRGECPMNLRTAYSDFAFSDAVLGDIKRLEVIWAYARENRVTDGPWLLGDYSIADVFYAPVAARLAGYGAELSKQAFDYVNAHLSDKKFRQWRAMGQVRGETLPWYAMPDLTTKPWPGPTPLMAEAVVEGPSENDACPYSGDPVADYLSIDGRVFGFCNAFCRDKTVADAEAWPAFMEIYRN